MNPTTLIDGYKFSHLAQYPAGTTRVYSNWTPRESRVPGIDHVVFFGLQYFLKRYLGEEFGAFFSGAADDACREYDRRLSGYLGPNNVGTEHIRALHKLQVLPLEFRAVPEGTRVPLRVPMLTVENTRGARHLQEAENRERHEELGERAARRDHGLGREADARQPGDARNGSGVAAHAGLA